VTAGAWSGLQPAANISWYEAAAFVNFLNTSTGHQAAYNLTYSGGAYTMALWAPGQSGYDASNPFRNSLATYFLPSQDEWYKAAYYDPANSSYNQFSTGNSTPTAVASGTNAGTAVYNNSAYNGPASVNQAGGASAYGTMGQGGNVWQWLEGTWDGNNNVVLEVRGVRGGNWSDNSDMLQSSFEEGFADPESFDINFLGFRVASVANAVPEPSTYALFGIGAIGMLMVLRRKKTA
jgi:formylglycine-generating enzyme required for sulfatase activity